MFELLKKEQPDFLEKIFVISGDCMLPNLGIEEKYQQILKNEVFKIIINLKVFSHNINNFNVG